MRKPLVAVAALALTIVGFSSTGFAAPPTRAQYIIKFVDTVNEENEVASIRANGGEVSDVFHNIFKGAVASLTEAQARGLAHNPRVEIIEQDGVVNADGVDNPTASWGLDRVDQTSLPLNSTYSYTTTGAGVTAYVIDTGILTSHTDFGGRAKWGTNTSGDRKNTDCNGHGTHVAGTIGGKKYGIAKSVNLIAVKVLNCQGSGSWSGVIAGMDWVVSDHKSGAAVANMSLGGSYSATLNAAVDKLVNDGVVVVVAAGNSNADACQTSPASAPNAITVGATDSSDNRASYSNYGSCLDIFAPGTGITSDWNTSTSATNTISGTSMATPHVVGVVARMLQNSTVTASSFSSSVVAAASADKVLNPGTGSPNKLLYIAPTN